MVGGHRTFDEDVAVSECRDSVLADIPEPHILQCASPLAVYALELVCADDNVTESRAVLEDEDSTITASVGIGVARPSTIILLVAHVFRAGDDTWGRKGHNRPNSCGNVQGLTSGKADCGTDEGKFETHLDGSWDISNVYKG